MGPPYWPRFCPMGFSNSPHSPKGGSEKKYRARPNRLWGHSKGRLGAPEPHLSGPIPPRIRPERGKPLFWPLGAGTPQRAKKKWRNGAKPEPATGMAGGGCPRGPGNRGGHGTSRIDDGFRCAALNLCLRPVSELRAGHFGRQRHTVKFCPFVPALFQS